MPFYGDPEQFQIAVMSVLNQSDPNWTLTVLDDCYPDLAPGTWLRGLGDTRISYVRNETNLLPSKNYNKALEMASGEFMMLMGCDDVLLPDFVARSSELIQLADPTIGLIQPGVRVIDEEGNPKKSLADKVKIRIGPWPKSGIHVISGENAHRSLLRGNWTYFPSILWRRSAIDEQRFRTDLNIVQDLSMILDLIENGFGILIDSEVTFLYRRHRASLSGATGSDGSKFAQERVLFAEAAARAQQRGWNDSYRAATNRLLSRLNSAVEIPSAVLRRDSSAIKALVRHSFGS